MKRAKREEDECSEIIRLNVGGMKLDCSLTTLTCFYPESDLTKMFQEKNRATLTLDKKGRYFIETDGVLFGHLLHYIRSDIPLSLVPPNVLKEVWQNELEYWGLSPRSPTNKLLNETEKRMDETIALLMEISDMRERLLRGHLVTSVLIPYNEYKTKWNQCLATYLQDASALFGQRLRLVLAFESFRIDGHNMSKAYAKDYSFNGKEYNTRVTKTIEITIIRLF